MAENEHAAGQSSVDLGARFESLVLRHRVVVNVLVHAVLFALSLLMTYVVRFDITGETFQQMSRSFLPLLPYFVLVKLVIFGRMRLFRGGWQYSGIRDVLGILLGAWVFLAITFALIYLLVYLPDALGLAVPARIAGYVHLYSRGVLVLDFLATVFLVCTARLGFRIWREQRRPISPDGLRRVLIVGAGNAAELIIREINRMREERYRVIGLVDDDERKRGMLIHGVPVLGKVGEIPDVCDKYELEEIIIAMPSATQKQIRNVVELCSGTKLKFQSLPSVTDLIDGRVTVSQIRPVDINDLLGREAVDLNDEAIGVFVAGRRVLITGGGGSIGSEMARQVSRYAPACLLLLEQAETPLFDIVNELRADYPDLQIEGIIADIYDRDRVMSTWQRTKPDVVIHAAAHKHVPLMEQNPCEAVKNNILGTRNVADASCATGVSEFVMISTDKAVNPSSVMGASKRVAEIYTQSLTGRDGCRTQFKAVRFGNVLGSAGSVVPTFRRQIARGGPVTVTHPEMTRYFMTIPEAAQLVLQAAATGTGGEIYLLDMGEPVKIVDLARNMITLSGFRPGEDIDVVFTGMRPGEKLFEELRTAGEDISPTVHPKVLIWKHCPTDWAKVTAAFEEFNRLKNSPDWHEVVQAIRKLVPEFHPPNPPQQRTPVSRSSAPNSHIATSAE